jgi:thiamine kinase-like enzyme
VYGQDSEQLFTRSKELEWLGRLSRLGLVPKLLATFGNGRVEEFLDNTTTLRKDTIKDAFLSHSIAVKLREFHAVSSAAYPPAHNEREEWWENVEHWIHGAERAVLNVRDKDARLDGFSMETLKGQVLAYKKRVDQLMGKDKHMVFAHNDLQYGNILKLNNKQDTDHAVAFVDFEYGGYNPRAFDVANHFCEWQADYHDEETPHELHRDWYPSVQQQEAFLASYLNQGIHAKEVTELRQQVEYYRGASEVMWGLWGLVQAERTDIEFDYVGYGLGRIHEFQRLFRVINNY